MSTPSVTYKNEVFDKYAAASYCSGHYSAMSLYWALGQAVGDHQT